MPSAAPSAKPGTCQPADVLPVKERAWHVETARDGEKWDLTNVKTCAPYGAFDNRGHELTPSPVLLRVWSFQHRVITCPCPDKGPLQTVPRGSHPSRNEHLATGRSAPGAAPCRGAENRGCESVRFLLARCHWWVAQALSFHPGCGPRPAALPPQAARESCGLP